MKKFVIALIFILFLIPVFAAQYDNTTSSRQKKMVIYLYTNECGVCKRFNPIFNSISSKYGQKCTFKKINANTQEGYNVLRRFNVRYVPFVIIQDNAARDARPIEYGCFMDHSCFDAVVDNFTK